jgi:hypothetical protein
MLMDDMMASVKEHIISLRTVTNLEAAKMAEDLINRLASFQSFCDLQFTSNDDMTHLAANFMKEFATFE